MTLAEKIQNALIDSRFMGIIKTEKLLSEIAGKPVSWYDTVIDDGIDNTEIDYDDDEPRDNYVMRACFSTDNDDLIVRVYYGDVREEIGYVSVEEDEDSDFE